MLQLKAQTDNKGKIVHTRECLCKLEGVVPVSNNDKITAIKIGVAANQQGSVVLYSNRISHDF
jgi:hypothetical protein